jgi:hypothetical protein
MREKKKPLEERFLKGEPLNLLDKLTIKLLQYFTDCDGMCGLSCDAWYCESKRVKYPINQ